jgi:signal transduction histidine kinase
MRRRLLLSTLLVVTLVLLVMTAPIILILREAATSELRAGTMQEATAIAASIADDLTAGRVPDLEPFDRLVADGDGVRVLDAGGVVIAERNAAGISKPYRTAVDGPDGTSIEVVTSRADVDDEFVDQMTRLAFAAAFAVVIAGLLAVLQARQLARPLERLARAAARLGDGDFTAAAPTTSGIAEINSIARAIRLSGSRVERMLESERGFTADATHQLRTGLTGLAMRLELLQRHHDPEVVAEATTTLGQIHDLNTTLDELLRVARKGSTGERTEVDLAALVRHHISDWDDQFAKKRRQIVVTTGIARPAFATPGLIGQILNVLIENALRHGRGTVAILVHECSVLVEDEGNGISAEQAATIFDRPTDHQAAHGRGLALARRLAEADGGRLELVARSPATFKLSLLPMNSTA